MLIINIMGASGSGKTTLADDLGFQQGVNITTRPKRSEDETGYTFVDEGKYVRMLKNGELMEYISHYGNFYGIPTPSGGEYVQVFVVDPCGATQIEKWAILNGHECLNLYLECPEFIRFERMKKRGDKPEDIQKRIESDKYFDKIGKNVAHVVIDFYEDKEETAKIAMRTIKDKLGVVNELTLNQNTTE